MSNYIDPFTDFGFKRIFGQEDHKRLLIGFLNALFEGEFVITDLAYRDKEQIGEVRQDRSIIYDIYCTLDDGERFIVEMQNRKHVNFDDRALYYISGSVYAQGKKGKDWNYVYFPVFGVYFMRFKEKVLGDAYRTDFRIAKTLEMVVPQKRHKNKKRATKESSLVNKIRMIFLQMPNFTLKADECKTNFEKWMYVMNHMDSLDKIPWVAQDELFEELAKVSNVAALTPEERLAYDEYLRQYRDNLATQQASVQTGERRGERRGKKREKRNIAKNMLADGCSHEIVSKYTGLTLAEIDKLSKRG